jgi:hypothetical protein
VVRLETGARRDGRQLDLDDRLLADRRERSVEDLLLARIAARASSDRRHRPQTYPRSGSAVGHLT